MSAGRKGRPASELNRMASAAARVGLKRSEDTRRKMSAAQKGKKHSPETLVKMSASRIGKPLLKNAGPNHYNWKGGDSRQRYPLEYMAWARAVKRRDHFTCRRCGHHQRRGMHAHHVLPWADFPQWRFDVSNGITLCPPCHRNTGLHVGVSRTKRHERRPDLANDNAPC